MTVTKDDILAWFEEAKAKNATHVIVVCDTFDNEDFPVYVMKGENAREVAKRESEKPMQRVMEVYSLSLPAEDQYKEIRSFHYE